MTNRFGLDLHPKVVRWAAAESVSEDVIAAVLLLHECSVEEIVPQLSPLELEKVIELVGRFTTPLPEGYPGSARPAQKFTGVRTDSPKCPAERGGRHISQRSRAGVSLISATSLTLIKCAKRMSESTAVNE
jgi:hypothetical protein